MLAINIEYIDTLLFADILGYELGSFLRPHASEQHQPWYPTHSGIWFNRSALK